MTRLLLRFRRIVLFLSSGFIMGVLSAITCVATVVGWRRWTTGRSRPQAELPLLETAASSRNHFAPRRARGGLSRQLRLRHDLDSGGQKDPHHSVKPRTDSNRLRPLN